MIGKEQGSGVGRTAMMEVAHTVRPQNGTR